MIRQTSTLYLAIVASILSLVLISTYGYSQKVKHITNRFPNSKIVAEEYYVLKSNKRMKHGEYTSYDAGIQGTVIMQFHLTPNCTFEDIRIIQSVSPECDEEALKCLKFMEKVYQQEESCTDGVKTFSIDFILN